MKIFSASQIREIDQYTINNEPISSLNLMERAAESILGWLLPFLQNQHAEVAIFCGPGNNGGDGLAVARMLTRHDIEVKVFLLAFGKVSPDHAANLARLPKRSYLSVQHCAVGEPFPHLSEGSVIVDAILGSGLTRPVEGYWARFITYLNQLPNPTVAIDIPSGLFADQATQSVTIEAQHTISLQSPKLAMLLPENARAVGQWHLVDIGLHAQIQQELDVDDYIIDARMIADLLTARPKYGHKGNFGHSLLICGSRGKMGAAVLAARGCLRSGAGLVTCHTPACGLDILQISVPEAMALPDPHPDYFSQVDPVAQDRTVGVGSGLGTAELSVQAMGDLLRLVQRPIVIDADGLNILARNTSLLELIPNGSILTPHVGEYRRLFGTDPDDFTRLRRQKELSQSLGVHIVLKGAHTCVTTPSGKAYFNTTGNPGMASGGSGDILTGMITGFLAQGVTPLQACFMGVYLHGLAGDLAKAVQGERAMIATDIIDQIGPAILRVTKE